MTLIALTRLPSVLGQKWLWEYGNDIKEVPPPLRRKEVKICLDRCDLNPLAYSQHHYEYRQDHVTRVAYLVRKDWSDALKVHACRSGLLIVLDGYHRIAAAEYLGRKELEVDLSGFA